MGLLDEYLYDPKRKMMMPPEGQGPLGRTYTGDDLMDPSGSARAVEALNAKVLSNADIPRGPMTAARYDAAPKDARGYAMGDRSADFSKTDIAPKPSMSFDLGDIGGKAPAADPRSMNFDLADIGGPGKLVDRLPQGDPRQEAPTAVAAAPKPPSGLLAPKPAMPAAFAEKAPLPPTRPTTLAGSPAPAMPPSRPVDVAGAPAPAMPVPRPPDIGTGLLAGRAPALAGGPPESAPLPPVRPPELGGIDTAAASPPLAVAENPIIGMGGDAASSVADAGSGIGAAAGGGDIFGGILGAVGGLAKAFGGGKGGGAPPARAPQFSPSNAGPTVDAQLAQDRQQAPQILAGILADDVKSLIDPRKQRQA